MQGKVKIINKYFLFWFAVFVLFLVPLVNSFCVNLRKIIHSLVVNNQYKCMLDKLYLENKKLSHKMEYYKTNEGIKTLIKERLDKVEKGEYLVRFREDKQNMNAK